MDQDKRKKYNEYHRKYNIERYYRLRKEAIDYLGGECKKCGSKENLELDHIDRITKEIDVAKMLNVSLERFWREVNKCQLLCSNCHSDKSILELGNKVARGTHGTLSSYRYCRCDVCREAWNKYCREYKIEWRKRKKALIV